MIMTNSESIKAYWDQCLNEAEGIDPQKGYREKCFGRSTEMASQLMALVASGQKTGTFSLLVEFSPANPLPEVGEQVIVTDFEGNPGCLYVIEEVETVPYQEISERHVALEGPRLRDVQLWRDVHWPYWTEYLATRGERPAMDMPVVFQRFRVLHRVE